MNRTLDVVTSDAATVVRAPRGCIVGRIGPRPSQRLELYEFEG